MGLHVWLKAESLSLAVWRPSAAPTGLTVCGGCGHSPLGADACVPRLAQAGPSRTCQATFLLMLLSGPHPVSFGASVSE